MNGQPDKLFFARLADMVSRAERNGTYSFSNFLDEKQSAEASQWCRYNTGGLVYKLWGGHEQADRKMLAVCPEYCEAYVIDEFPLKCITFKYRKEDKLTHRDFLGTLMGMNFKREIIGDIIIGEGKTQAFVTETAAKLIMTTVSKIGRTGVSCFDDIPFELEVKKEFAEVSGTVASLRLDCVVALAANVSREKAAALIRGERIDVNHFAAASLSQELKEGDILSIRGCGRFILSGINGVTKKGRIHIILKKYI